MGSVKVETLGNGSLHRPNPPQAIGELSDSEFHHCPPARAPSLDLSKGCNCLACFSFWAAGLHPRHFLKHKQNVANRKNNMGIPKVKVVPISVRKRKSL